VKGYQPLPLFTVHRRCAGGEPGNKATKSLFELNTSGQLQPPNFETYTYNTKWEIIDKGKSGMTIPNPSVHLDSISAELGRHIIDHTFV